MFEGTIYFSLKNQDGKALNLFDLNLNLTRNEYYMGRINPDVSMTIRR